MSTHVSTERMNEALDGALTSAEMDALHAHVDGCAVCRNTYARLSEVTAAVRALPKAATPPDDLWAEIAGRIEAEPATEAEPAAVLRLPTASDESHARRWSLSLTELAAAAAVVAFLSAGSVWIALGGVPAEEAAVVVADEAVGESALRGAAARAVSTDRARYGEAVAQLERVLDQGRAVLAPETLARIDESLSVLDAAIEEIEAALAEDPNSDLLLRMLASQQRTKLGILERAAAAVQAQT